MSCVRMVEPSGCVILYYIQVKPKNVASKCAQVNRYDPQGLNWVTLGLTEMCA